MRGYDPQMLNGLMILFSYAVREYIIQESLERSSANKTCNQVGLDMINDAFGYHQYNDGMGDDKETSGESSHKSWRLFSIDARR